MPENWGMGPFSRNCSASQLLLSATQVRFNSIFVSVRQFMFKVGGPVYPEMCTMRWAAILAVYMAYAPNIARDSLSTFSATMTAKKSLATVIDRL